VDGVELDRRLEGQLAVEVGPALAVADGAERRERGVEALAEGARLLHQARVELCLGPGTDAAAELGGLERQL
jgi:hypothetical protein